MASNNETVAEIVSEMREWRGGGTVKVFMGEMADRIEAAHKREIAAKDAEIEELQRTLDLHDLCADEECEDADVARIVAECEADAKDAEIAELRERIKEAEEFATEMKESTNSLVRACGHQVILRLRGDAGEVRNERL